MFKNISIYIPASSVAGRLHELQDAAEKHTFSECGPTQRSSSGWVEPRGELNGPLVESIDRQWIMRLKIEERVVSSGTFKKHMDERLRLIETNEGRKPGNKEKKDLRDEIMLDLLPTAQLRYKVVPVWIDVIENRLIIGSTVQTLCDKVVSLLVEMLPGFAVSYLQTKQSPQGAMAAWLRSYDAPSGFSIDTECELKATDESRAVVRYTNHPLGTDEIREHIDQGKLPTSLRLTFDDRISFTLTQHMDIKKIKLLDVVTDDADPEADVFDSTVVIETCEIGALLDDLIASLGGIEHPDRIKLPGADITGKPVPDDGNDDAPFEENDGDEHDDL